MQASATYQEILTQVAAWQDALHAVSAKQADVQRLWQAGAYDSIVVTGCGSTHYLSMIAANLLQTHAGVAARAWRSPAALTKWSTARGKCQFPNVAGGC